MSVQRAPIRRGFDVRARVTPPKPVSEPEERRRKPRERPVRANAILILVQIADGVIPDRAVITPGGSYGSVRWTPVASIEVGSGARLTLYRAILTTANVDTVEEEFDNTFTAEIPFRMASAVFHFPTTTSILRSVAVGPSPLEVTVPGETGDQHWEFEGRGSNPEGGAISVRMGSIPMSFLYFEWAGSTGASRPGFATDSYLVMEKDIPPPGGIEEYILDGATTGVQGTDWRDWIGEPFFTLATSHYVPFFIELFP